ncbi:MAG: sulfate adenylyltransferase subunit 2 [Rickettsiales bacterium]|jgi:sulfate adenylyltransferase subunit 2
MVAKALKVLVILLIEKLNKEKMQNKYLKNLEEESVYIIREAMAEFENPVFLYSIGKDSTVLLHLILKAFYPLKPTFPVLHVDTGWKFKEMIEFRDKVAKDFDLNLLVCQNQQGLKDGINPFDHGSKHTDVMKTDALKQALNKYRFDCAFGGARRDEEKSRAKERMFSFRNEFHAWDAKNQRPELFNNFNTKINKDQSIRVFPLSNWTEIDIWEYIKQENIGLVPLYFAKERPVVVRDGITIMVDDDRMKLLDGEVVENKKVRFRTLGCYPLTGAMESEADDLDKIIKEIKESEFSERQGRLIDADQIGSMEKKKAEGYF